MSDITRLTPEQQTAYWKNSAKGYAAEIERLNVWNKAFIDDLIAAEADRDRARDAAVALEQETARLTAQLGDEEFNAAIEKLSDFYRFDAEPFMSVIETVRDEETVHDDHHPEFVDGCMGCFTERLADAITRAANGGEG